MTTILIKPRPPPNTTATSQKPLTEPTASSSYSTNRPSKESRSSTKSGHSLDFKLLEAKIDLILDQLVKPPLAPTPDPIVTSSITFEDLKKAFRKVLLNSNQQDNSCLRKLEYFQNLITAILDKLFTEISDHKKETKQSL